ncbi:MAG TPA: hypothetical protein VGG46_12565 [Terriglobales bacterium]
MKSVLRWCAVPLLAVTVVAQTTTTTSKKVVHHAAKSPITADDVQQLRDALAAQQRQIEQLWEQMQTREATIQRLQQESDQAQAAAAQAQQKVDATLAESATKQQNDASVHGDIADLKAQNASTTAALHETQKRVGDLESPLTLHYKGISISPVGFLAAETVWRQHGLGADLNTPFNSIPFDGSSQSSLSEFFGSGRQSRAGLLAVGKLTSTTLTGYMEADFLSSGTTSNNNQSNSYTLRQRQMWGQAALDNGWSFTGGQMWSLVTETRNGVDNRTEALPMTIDPAYHVGFSWARQYGFRVSKDFGNKMWLAFSVENPQTTFAGHGTSANFLIGTAGNSGGLYNAFNGSYSFNEAPDFVAKAVFQPGWGHYEVFGVVSTFRDRIFPNATAATPSAVGAFNNSVEGWGIGGNFRGSMFNKHMDVGVHFLGGNGVGRYGTSTLPDVTVNPSGNLVPIRSYQTLGTLEWHYPKLDIYTNAGAEYAGRTVSFTSATTAVGYGSPFLNNSGCGIETVPGAGGFAPGALANCTGDTRNILEGTVGFWYRFYKGPKGTLQWGPQYSYLVRNTWNGLNGTSAAGQPTATENMFLTSFRYYLP